jgi:hypothetical protein
MDGTRSLSHHDSRSVMARCRPRRRISFHRQARSVLSCCIAATFFACNLFTSGDCTAVGGFGIILTVVDSLTQAPPVETPSLTVTDGAYVESHAAPNGQGVPGRFTAASEREGLYTLLVQTPGYVDWTKQNVRVIRGGDCNALKSVRLTALLQRAVAR